MAVRIFLAPVGAEILKLEAGRLIYATETGVGEAVELHGVTFDGPMHV